MSRNTARPLSPHLFSSGLRIHYHWGPHMLVSILNRMMGVGLATVGVAGFTWWLGSLASGTEAYASFMAWATWRPLLIFPIGLTFAFFFHMLSGLRHFVMDAGAGFELKTNRNWAIAVIVAAVLLTALIWAYVLLGKN